MENGEEKTGVEVGAPRVRTYERDVEEFLKKEGGTAAKFALAEQERKITNYEQIRPPQDGSASSGKVRTEIKPTLTTNIQNPPPTPSFTKEGVQGGGFSPPIPSPEAARQVANARSLILWSILFLVLAGVIGVGYWYISNLPPREAAPLGASAQKIILADKEKTLDATRIARDTFLSAFARERDAGLALSSFVRIIPTRTTRNETGEAVLQALTTRELLSLLETRASGELLRALELSFVLGLRGLPQNRVFLVFKTPYYRTAFAGMLEWEVSLLHDIGPLFGSQNASISAPASAEVLAGRATGFVDRTLQNRDVREFLGEDGKPLILWGFTDQRTVIIADDEDTFQKVMERLVATK